ncbi:hypothetical protein HPB47_002275 [Ixodes persulcatus]|uniref:Uncharacterized protein n=1 Tax=Ixodes persulcatus TaxID=34615 RepID=A0AC60PML1_IXOPE|nr:hypothetical protein HPB47_002275 [Ixodes persulcatus]
MVNLSPDPHKSGCAFLRASPAFPVFWRCVTVALAGGRAEVDAPRRDLDSGRRPGSPQIVGRGAPPGKVATQIPVRFTAALRPECTVKDALLPPSGQAALQSSHDVAAACYPRTRCTRSLRRELTGAAAAWTFSEAGSPSRRKGDGLARSPGHFHFSSGRACPSAALSSAFLPADPVSRVPEDTETAAGPAALLSKNGALPPLRPSPSFRLLPRKISLDPLSQICLLSLHSTQCLVTFAR